jgi:CheY-like chemotaxis protein
MTLNVLLVDDDPVVREVLSAQLRALGCTVECAATCEQAEGLARDARFDRLLLDQRLGDTDGVQLLRTLRRFDGAAAATAIAISAELDDGASQRLRACGFAATLLKPVTIATLAEALALPLPATAATAPSTVLDDPAALAIWGSMATVAQLRRILLDELALYREALQRCCAARDGAALREILHRMRSSAGFCGARPLLQFIDATAPAAPDWALLLQRYDAASDALRPALQEALAP